MRVRTVAGGLTVNAVAGSCVVALGLNINDADRAGPRGFAIRREDKTEGETIWMKGTKTFESVEPHPAPGEQFSSLLQPFQTFQWADYTAKPGYTYADTVVAMIEKGDWTATYFAANDKSGRMPRRLYFSA